MVERNIPGGKAVGRLVVGNQKELKYDPTLGFLVVNEQKLGDRIRVNTKIVSDNSELPPVSNGRHQLVDNTVYLFDGIVQSDYGLEYGSITPTIGMFGATDGFICTGGGPALYSRGNPFFMKDMYTHAPGGQLMDLQADSSTEFLCYFSSFSDAVGFGNIANIGVIDGFRVPTFTSVNMEEFDSGLTLTGQSNKVFINSCPIRNISSSGVTILSFDSNFSTSIVDIAQTFFKNVQSDTEIVNVDPSAIISDIFQYRGTTHDSTVTKSNILTGDAGEEKVGYRITDSYPLSDSGVAGAMSFNSLSTISISSQATDEYDESAYVPISGSFTASQEERMTVDATNQTFTYDGKRDARLSIEASISAGTGNSDRVAMGIFRNGSLVDRSVVVLQMTGTAGGVDKIINSILFSEAVTDDTFQVKLANLDSTTDIDVKNCNIQVST